MQNNPKSDEVKFQKKTLQSSNVQPFHSKNRLDEVNENKKHYRASLLDFEHVNDVKRTFFFFKCEKLGCHKNATEGNERTSDAGRLEEDR